MLKGNLGNYTAPKTLFMVLGGFTDPAARLCLILLAHTNTSSDPRKTSIARTYNPHVGSHAAASREQSSAARREPRSQQEGRAW